MLIFQFRIIYQMFTAFLSVDISPVLHG